MSRNGSGIYSLAAGNPVVTGTTVSSTWANSTLTDIASALTTSIASDGQTVISANIPMNSKKLTGLAAPTLAGDALSFGAVATISTLTATTVNSALNGTLGATTPSTVVATTGTFNGGATTTTPLTCQSTQNSVYFTLANSNSSQGYIGYEGTGGTNMTFYTANTEKMRIDASGNIGVGVTPSAWSTAGNSSAIQIRNVGIYAVSTNSVNFSTNAYYDGTWRYISNTGVANYAQSAGIHYWYGTATGAAAGTAIGTPFSTSTMTLDASGNLGIGTATPASKLDVLNTFRVSYASGSVYYASITNISGGTVINANGDSAGMTFGTTVPGGTTPTTRMTLDNVGGLKLGNTIGVGNATPSTSGAGITFPATQSASTDANTLDDYEEGTWTPNQGSGLTVVGAYTSSGTYTKVGNIVNVTTIQRGATSISATSTGVLCTNLPFSVLSTSPANSWGVVSNTAGTVAGIVNASGTIVYNNGTVIAATPNIYFSITYQTA